MADCPLSGVTVIDFTHVLAGPFCTMLLAEMGADVVKVESRRGDQIRKWSGPAEVPVAFHNVNRGKRSIVIDLTKTRGRQIAFDLASSADILVENFRSGTMTRLGLGYDVLAKQNPALVYGSITGFGADGPYHDRGGYDLIIQGMAGIMSVTGQPGSPPTKAGVPVADLSSGLFALAGIAAAYSEAKTTGHGRHVEVSLLESAIALTLWESAQYWMSGTDPEPIGSAHRFSAPYQVFEVKDGHLTVAANTDDQFRALLSVVDAPDLEANPKFRTNVDRVAHRAELAAVLGQRMSMFSRDDLVEKLLKARVPAGPIYSTSQVYDDPHVLARGVVSHSVDHHGRSVPIVRTPIRLGERSAVARVAPELGEHTRPVLRDLLDLSESELADLEKDGVIGTTGNSALGRVARGISAPGSRRSVLDVG